MLYLTEHCQVKAKQIVWFLPAVLGIHFLYFLVTGTVSALLPLTSCQNASVQNIIKAFDHISFINQTVCCIPAQGALSRMQDNTNDTKEREVVNLKKLGRIASF